MINGIAAHVLDYDDVGLDGHPSAVLVPAILAQGEASGSSGAEMLTAYMAGFEVWAEILAREPTPLHRKGWHPSAVLGAVAAAAACAKLRGLDPERAATAMAIAASMSCGVVANFGTMTKSFQVARAAQSGVIAARLAQAGLTASLDALEHPSGLLAALSPEGKAERDRAFDRRAQGVAYRRRGAQHQALSDLLRDPSLDRRRAWTGRAPRSQTRCGRTHPCLDRGDATAHATQ